MDVEKVIVDGKEITLEEFMELQSNPKLRLKKLTESEYKSLQKLEG